MDLNPIMGTIGRDDPSWLGSARGTSQAQSIALVMGLFIAATHYPNGYLPSGLPLILLTSGPNAGRYGPFGAAGQSRTVADGATTAASTTLTSATATFVAGDVGAAISGGSIPAGTTIASVTNATTVVLSAAATATATGVSITVTVAGSGNLAGFLLTATAAPRNPATTVINGPLLDSGRVIVAKLPITVSAAAQATNPRFVFV